MICFVNDAQMKTIDQTTIRETGIPSLILMEQAASFVAFQIEKRIRECGLEERLLSSDRNRMQSVRERITVFAGTGNNGADGLAVARILFLKGFRTEVFCMGNPDKATEEWKCQSHILTQLQIEQRFLEENDLTPEGMSKITAHSLLLVDGIFGIGLKREVGGDYYKLISLLNEIAVPKLAIDIPSGIYASNGQIAGIAVQCQMTVTFGREKTGQHIYPGKMYCGKIISAPLGFSPAAYEKAGYDARQFSYEEIAHKLPTRPADGHKITFGKVLVVAGCRTMAGAAVFSAKAACRSGAGLVKIYSVTENRDVLLHAVPEAILSFYDPAGINEEQVLRELDWADTVVFGPGMGKEEYVYQLLRIILRNLNKTLILDADGIRVLAAHRELFSYLNTNVILTPHIGEMSALTQLTGQELLADPVVRAAACAKSLGCIIVMKSAVSVIASPEEGPVLEDRGCNALGTAGSGDVLTGIIAAFSAGGGSAMDAAVCGCGVHALAGKEAEEKIGGRSAMASDIIESLTRVFCHIEKHLLDETYGLQL